MTKFSKGDLVFHRSNPNFKMVIIYIHYMDENDSDGNDSAEHTYTCRWVSTNGKIQECDFTAVEILRIL